MGRSYLFECPKCGYKAKVSGHADQGAHFAVQTILCRDCRELYDAVTGWKIRKSLSMIGGAKSPARLSETPPTFQKALNRLRFVSGQEPEWRQFKIRCPVSPAHRVQLWNEPDKCPKCKAFLEKSAIPFRIWE